MARSSTFPALLSSTVLLAPLLPHSVDAADCNGNNRDDQVDIQEGFSKDCNRNGGPDECDVLPPIVGGGILTQLQARLPGSLAAGDFDGDSDPDIITSNWFSSTLSLAINDGGALRLARSLAVDAGPRDIQSADLDGDGDLDLVVACREVGSIVTFANAGAADFSRLAAVLVDAEPFDLALFSMDGQGPPDIAVLHAGLNTVTLVRNRGGWQFERLPDILHDSQPMGLGAADFDQDGNADLAFSMAAISSPGLPDYAPHRVSIHNGQGNGSFTLGPYYEVSDPPGTLWAGDLDGDSLPDAVYASSIQRRLQILWNDSGSLQAAAMLNVEVKPYQFSPADLDGDGDRDLAACGSDGVLVVENRGERTFTPWPKPSVPWAEPYALVTAEMNGDGIPDLAVVHPGSCCEYRNGELGLLPGQGAGAFGAPQRLPVDFKPTSAALADWDLDGDVDGGIASSSQSLFAICQNDGSGSLGEPRFYSAGAAPGWVHAGDADDDGDPDFLLSDEAALKIVTHANSGLGRFPASNVLTTSFPPRSVALVDHQGDGDSDLLYTSPHEYRLVLLRKDGPGALVEAMAMLLPYRPLHVKGLDIDGAGDVEILLSEVHGLLVLRLTDSLDLQEVERANVSDALQFDLADVDDDGRLDVVDASQSGLRIQRQLRGGFAGRSVNLGSGGGLGRVLDAADFDADGRPDFLSTRSTSEVAALFRTVGSASSLDLNGNGAPDECDLKEEDCNDNGVLDVDDIRSGASLDCNANDTPDECDIRPNLGLAPPVGFTMGGSPYGLITGDLNNDGYADIGAAAPNIDSVVVFVSDRGLSMKTPRTYRIIANVAGESSASMPWGLAMADLDADGDLDLAVVNEGRYSSSELGGSVVVLRNAGDGALTARPFLRVGPSPRSIAAADFDGDGRVDLSTANTFDGTLSLLLATPQGGFSRQADISLGASGQGVSIADFNGDAVPDIAATLYRADQIAVLTNGHPGGFAEPVYYPAGKGPIALTATDLDGNGRPDLAVACTSSGSISVFLTAEDGSLQPQAPALQQVSSISIAAADLDANGRTDLAAAASAVDTVWIHLNQGADGFEQAREYKVGRHPLAIAIGDVDGENGLDVIAGVGEGETINDDGLAVLLNYSSFSRDCNASQVPDECEIATAVLHDANGDGIADECLSLLRFGPAAPPDAERFRRGDANVDGAVDVGDPVFILLALFLGTSELSCLDAADADNSSSVKITDTIFLLRFLFLAGPAPPFPGAPPLRCGPDPEPEGSVERLGCRVYERC